MDQIMIAKQGIFGKGCDTWNLFPLFYSHLFYNFSFHEKNFLGSSDIVITCIGQYGSLGRWL